ncbi:MAG: type II toxin-antitoxin system HicB family antitoxin [Oscillospiraceae bacterium]|nr:type II toxin-antitoxin system HicB family antitoxin [Oscillospiraceae bacterium]
MSKKMTPAEIERRMKEINAQPEEEQTAEEAASLAAADAMDDGTTVSLEDFKKDLEDYSGRFVLRIPRSLHKTLKEAAAEEGVSLNQYIIYKLTL